MRNYFYSILFLTILFSSCSGFKRIGQFTMISTRNIDNSKEYSLITKDAEAIVKTSNDDALQAAIDKAVALSPEGEYLMNVKVYISEDGGKLKVVGDVYGLKKVEVNVNTTVNASISFNTGDSVYFTKNDKLIEGKIIGINTEGAIVEYKNALGKTLKNQMSFDKLTKK